MNKTISELSFSLNIVSQSKKSTTICLIQIFFRNICPLLVSSKFFERSDLSLISAHHCISNIWIRWNWIYKQNPIRHFFLLKRIWQIASVQDFRKQNVLTFKGRSVFLQNFLILSTDWVHLTKCFSIFCISFLVILSSNRKRSPHKILHSPCLSLFTPFITSFLAKKCDILGCTLYNWISCKSPYISKILYLKFLDHNLRTTLKMRDTLKRIN